MNDLLILEIEQGRWVARVANTDIEYAFKYLVEEPDLSSLCVQSLALAMQSGRQQVIDSIAGNGIFDLPAGTPPETVVAELFDATAALRYEGPRSSWQKPFWPTSWSRLESSCSRSCPKS